MAKRLTILLVALLALGFVVAGCGDDDDDKADDNTATQQATTQETETSQDSGGSPATGVPATPRAKQAIEQCKTQSNANPQLSADAKKKIGEVCEEAGSGDADGAVKATREACEIIVKDTVKQEGPAKQSALDACKQSTKTP